MSDAHQEPLTCCCLPPWLLLLWMLIIVLGGLYSESATAAHKHTERWYQEAWCTEGVMEYVLPDRTRVDCLTETHAIELDFANKWYEGITQALWYSRHTGRRAAVLLIIERDKDMRYYDRAQQLVAHFELPVDIWIIRSPD